MSKKSLDSAAKLFYNSVFTGNHRLEIKVIRQASDSECFSLLKAVQHFGILAESLCRDTSLIKTGTSNRTSLDKNHFHSSFRSKKGCLISSRSCTYNYNLHSIDKFENEQTSI